MSAASARDLTFDIAERMGLHPLQGRLGIIEHVLDTQVWRICLMFL